MMFQFLRRTAIVGIVAGISANPLLAAAVPKSAPAIPVVARGYRAPEFPSVSSEIVGITGQPFVGIRLHDAIAMALRKNTDLAIAGENMKIARYAVVAAKGNFDLRFQVAPSVTHLTEAPTNAFFAGPNFSPIVQNQQKLGGAVSALLPGGQSVSVGLSQSKTIDNTFINAFNPSYATSLNVALDQPLLRGAGMNPAKEQLQLAVVGSRAARAQARAQAAATIASVESTYWQLVAAWRSVAIAQSALREAKLQEGSVDRLVARGAAAPIERTEAHSQVESFRATRDSALQQVAALQNSLKSQILSESNDSIWLANLVPTSPARALPKVATLNALVERALHDRPEIAQSAAASDEAAIALATAKNGVLPKIDLTLGYQSNGFAGIPTNVNPLGSGPVTPVPGYLAGSMAQSYHNLWGGRFPVYNAQITYSTTFGHRRSHAALETAQAKARIAALQSKGVVNEIVIENRNALQAYRSALARLAATRAARIAAEAVYQSEVRKYKNGASTTFLVLQRQVQLERARGAELQAQTDLNIAVVEIEQASGTILAKNHVRLDEIGSGVSP